MEEKIKEQRVPQDRYPTHQGSEAHIDVNADGSEFTKVINALVIDESLWGCGLITTSNLTLEVGDTCRVKIDANEPLRSEVTWKKKIDQDIVKLGIKYLDATYAANMY